MYPGHVLWCCYIFLSLYMFWSSTNKSQNHHLQTTPPIFSSQFLKKEVFWCKNGKNVCMGADIGNKISSQPNGQDCCSFFFRFFFFDYPFSCNLVIFYKKSLEKIKKKIKREIILTLKSTFRMKIVGKFLWTDFPLISNWNNVIESLFVWKFLHSAFFYCES